MTELAIEAERGGGGPALDAATVPFAQVADALPQLICAFSQRGDYLYLNRAMREFTGLSLPLRQGQGLRDLVHPGDLPAVEARWRGALARGELFRVDVRLRAPGGEYQWFEMLSTPVRRAPDLVDDTVWYTVAVCIDDRRELMDDLQLVLDAFPGMIALWDKDLRNRYANSGQQRILGLSPRDSHGRHIRELIGEERYSADEPDFRAALAGEVRSFDRELSTPSGEVRHLRVSLVPLEREGQPRGLLTMAHDVTDLLHAWSRLREAEGRFALAFEQAALGYCLVDLQGTIVRVNPAMARIFAAAPDELVGLRLRELLHESEQASVQGQLDLLLQGELPHANDERRCRRRDGKSFAAELSKTLVRGDDGAALHYFIQVSDISSRKHAEEALQRVNADLRRSNDDLERFAYLASHDLQEPLRTVASYTKLLAERYSSAFDERGHRYIGYAVDAAQRMQQLISGLLELSRLGKEPPVKAPVPLAQVVVAVQRLLAKTLVAGKVELRCEDLPIVQGHHDHLLRLFQNLISNSIKFSSPGRAPVIEIGGQRQDDGWRLWVRDNGVGIPPEYRERVFGMFQRLHTREQVAGNGIGLAVVRRIAELHGGRVWIADGAQGGTSVELWLPAT